MNVVGVDDVVDDRLSQMKRDHLHHANDDRMVLLRHLLLLLFLLLILTSDVCITNMVCELMGGPSGSISKHVNPGTIRKNTQVLACELGGTNCVDIYVTSSDPIIPTSRIGELDMGC